MNNTRSVHRLGRLFHLAFSLRHSSDSWHSWMDVTGNVARNLFLHETGFQSIGRCTRLERRRQSNLLRLVRFLRRFNHSIELQQIQSVDVGVTELQQSEENRSIVEAMHFRYTFVISLANVLTSVFAGFVIFAYLGYLSYITGQTVENVVSEGEIVRPSLRLTSFL